jgi:hypothetical protein
MNYSNTTVQKDLSHCAAADLFNFLKMPGAVLHLS